MTLDQLWSQHRELFDNDSRDSFLLTKVLDANDKLSVQVHPDDDYALKHEGELGKTECWYILDAAPGAEIIYGVHAHNKQTLIDMIDNHEFDSLSNVYLLSPVTLLCSCWHRPCHWFGYFNFRDTTIIRYDIPYL